MKAVGTKFLLRFYLVGFIAPYLLPIFSCVAAEDISIEAKTNFEWFSRLGFPDVKGRAFVHVTTKWWDPKAQWPAQSNFLSGFLLTNDAHAFVVLDEQLIKHSNEYTTQREYTTQGAHMQIENSYVQADLKTEAADLLKRITSLQSGEDLFPRLGERISKRARAFALAYACWRNGLNGEAEDLYQAAKKLRSGNEGVDGNNFQLILEREIAYAVMWRAVVDFDDLSVSRQQLLKEFQDFTKRYPHSEYLERAEQTAAKLDRMISEDQAHVKSAPANLASVPVEEQVRELIFRLRDQHGEQSGQPGWCDIFDDWRGVANSPAHQLVRIGYPAVPQLIAALEDPTFTRSVGYWRDYTFSHDVLTVGDCAVAILGRITGKYFYVSSHSAGFMSTDGKVAETHQRAVDWWAEFQKKGERQMLVEDVEAGDENAITEASRLVEHYPDVAPAALVKGIRATMNATVGAGLTEDMRVRRGANIRKALIEIFQKCDSNAARTYLQKELHEGNDGSRVSAAEVLVQSNRDDVIKAMIQEWQNSPDYKVEQDQGWTECARFLASVDSPQTIYALGQNFQARPFNTRKAIVYNIGEGGTPYGEIRPISERSLSASAIEDFLVQRLDDTEQQSGDSGPHVVRLYRERDARVCDLAGYYLNKLWPSRYHFDYSYLSSLKISDQERIECQNAWKQSRK